MENRHDTTVRKIIHIDMDAYYASIEQRDFPEYRGKPIAVGGSPDGRGGVVATASYEARKFGVKSAMPSKMALQLCPQLVFVKPRFDVYKSVSQHIRSIFHRYTDLVEPLSLDEAYLDVTEDKLGVGSAITIAEAIRKAIWEELGLTASAGVSVNKFVAKVASDLNKPNGMSFIGPSKIEAFMEGLKVEKFFGVGKVTAARMNKMGIFTGADLKKMEEQALLKSFGKAGAFYYRIVRGIDDRPVQPHRETKSVGAEDTFPYDLTLPEEMYDELGRIARIVKDRLMKHGLKGRTLTLKIKYGDFTQITRSRSLPFALTELETIRETAIRLLQAITPGEKGIRLLGISVSNFEGRNEQETLRSMAGSGQLSLSF
ncbi:DNA polymerase IV [Parasegetibacter sp. NRK P23]|uniref:DNA polymerase IV n=1 Tax=Parasegetibacter sp. NRK P23 TaxID=2942999 RepID=UPI0020445A8D|nr:DNA polymerase IV [Parasegetibacter sp. NRK P23]MCM5527987.1 DNA polymerase IV [Parasegetibacter sp. NRK P23]